MPSFDATSSVSPTQKVLGVLLVEDHMLTNECLKMGLEKYPDMKILGQAADGEKAVELALSLKPDIILMDVCLPRQNGVQATAIIKKALPNTKVIMTTSMIRQDVVKASFSAQADGYCSKETQLSQLVEIMRSVYKGNVYIDPKVAMCMVRELAGQNQLSDSLLAPDMLTVSTPQKEELPTKPIPNTKPPAVVSKSVPVFSEAPVFENSKMVSKPATLGPANMQPMPKVMFSPTMGPVDKAPARMLSGDEISSITGRIEDNLKPREIEILKLIAENHNNDEIAKMLNLSPAWLSGYIKNILMKLSVENEIQAIRKALNEGLIEDAPLLYEFE